MIYQVAVLECQHGRNYDTILQFLSCFLLTLSICMDQFNVEVIQSPRYFLVGSGLQLVVQ